MRLPAAVLGVLRLGVGASAIALPACDLLESGGEAQAALQALPEVAESAKPEAAAPIVAEATPAREGLGRDLASAVERARIQSGAAPESAPALGLGLGEDPTVVVPFSEDPSRVAPIRPRDKTPTPRVRARVRPRIERPTPVTPVIAIPPPHWDGCPACGRG